MDAQFKRQKHLMYKGQSIKRIFLLIIIFIGSQISGIDASVSLAQTLPTDEWISQYEAVMDGAARTWITKEYAKSMDRLTSAKKLLSYNMPLPTRVYEWRMYRALQTYTLVLTRLVEVDHYKSEENVDRMYQAARQAREWGRMLAQQSNDWSKVKVIKKSQMEFRKKWVSRFRKSLEQAAKTPRPSDSN